MIESDPPEGLKKERKRLLPSQRGPWQLSPEERFLGNDLIDLLSETQPTQEEFFWQKLFISMMKTRSDIVEAPPAAGMRPFRPVADAMATLKAISDDGW